jgi:hypothetical protein
LEKVSRSDEPELRALMGIGADALRHDLDEAWNNRADAIDGQNLFDRLEARSRSLQAEGR